MIFSYNDNDYEVEIVKKMSNKNTYIRVKKDMTIQVTTNYFTSEKAITKLIEDNLTKIEKMLSHQEVKNENKIRINYGIMQKIFQIF